MFCPLVWGHDFAGGRVFRIEFIAQVPGGHVDVVMPDILVSGRFIVLADRDAAAAIDIFHR